MKKIGYCLMLFTSILFAQHTPVEELAAFVSAFVSVAPDAFDADGRWQTLETLLAQGATFATADVDINSPHSTGITLLHCAARIGNDFLVGTLLAQGADPNLHDNVLYNTPLHLAAKRNFISIIELLYQAGAELDLQNGERATPLHVAVMQHNTDAVSILLAYGANTELRDRYGHTALDYARARGYEDILALML